MDGVTNSHALLIDIQRAMMQSAHKVIFCFDHTKIGRRSVAHLCTLESIDAVVTNSSAPTEIVSDLRQRGLRVLIAGEEMALQSEEKPAEAAEQLSGEMSWD